MGEKKGSEWDPVIVIEQKEENPRVQCKNRAHESVGGAPRIREHFMKRKPTWE
jgi:hypothetical protein